MKRIVALATVAAFALTSTLTATAASESTNTHKTTPIHAGPQPRCTAAAFRPFSAAVWNKHRWRREKPRHRAILAKHRRLECAGAGARKAMLARWQRDRLRFGRYRAFRLIAPYPGGGTYWAIPGYIVACESGGSWTAYNPSGASGPYQLMPEWGAPFPATTWHEKMQTHRIAANLYDGGAGASNWVCA